MALSKSHIISRCRAFGIPLLNPNQPITLPAEERIEILTTRLANLVAGKGEYPNAGAGENAVIQCNEALEDAVSEMAAPP